MRGDLQIIEDVGNMNGSDSRPSTGPDEPLPGQLANRGGGRGGGNKYASTPDVRNAVMDYYRSDTKSNKNSNLSALMTSAKPGPMDFDDFGGGGGGGGGYGGGESVITLEEFQDLKRAFQTMVEAQASQKRGARFKIDWKWYHILLLIVFNDIVLIAVGMAIGSAFYGVGPLVGGSFTADAIQVEEMSVLPERGEAHGLLHSVDGSSKLDLRSHTGNIAQISLGDHESNDNAIFNMLATTRSGMTPALEIREGYEARIAVLTNSRGTDIALNPYDRGKVSCSCNGRLDLFPGLSRLAPRRLSSLKKLPTARSQGVRERGPWADGGHDKHELFEPGDPSPHTWQRGQAAHVQQQQHAYAAAASDTAAAPAHGAAAARAAAEAVAGPDRRLHKFFEMAATRTGSCRKSPNLHLECPACAVGR